MSYRLVLVGTPQDIAHHIKEYAVEAIGVSSLGDVQRVEGIPIRVMYLRTAKILRNIEGIRSKLAPYDKNHPNDNLVLGKHCV